MWGSVVAPVRNSRKPSRRRCALNTASSLLLESPDTDGWSSFRPKKAMAKIGQENQKCLCTVGMSSLALFRLLLSCSKINLTHILHTRVIYRVPTVLRTRWNEIRHQTLYCNSFTPLSPICFSQPVSISLVVFHSVSFSLILSSPS